MKLKHNNPDRARKYFLQKLAYTCGPAELKYMIDEGLSPVIVDVRSAEDYAEEHVPGAINLPEEQWDKLDRLSLDQNNIIYCYTVVCHLGAEAAAHFAKKGYPVVEMEGGFRAWKEYGYETEFGSEKERKPKAA